jgi:hypothetical protein
MTKKYEPDPATDGKADEAGEKTGPTWPSSPSSSSPSSAEYSVAFSPRQVAVGLAIVAGLVAIAFRHRRNRDRKTQQDR